MRLIKLNLENNNISIIDSFENYSFDNLTKLDPSNPLKLLINLKHNKIGKFKMINFLYFNSWDTLKSIYITYGYLIFDIGVVHIYMDFNDNPIMENNYTVDLNISEFIFNNLTCFGPKENTGLFRVIKIIDLLCDFEQDCPEACDCKIRPGNKTMTINCSNQALHGVPMLPSISYPHIYIENVELIIDNNYLTELPSANYSGFNKITMIRASNNQIHSIGIKHLPDKLNTLDIRNNSLQFLDDDVIDRFERFSKLYLSGNPWRCNCAAVKLLKIFNLFRHLSVDAADMICVDGRGFRCLRPEDLCFQYIYLIVILLSLISLIGSCYIIFLTFKKQIKLWLYYHNCCLWWVTEEELDKDKDYDAFIVFSHFDDSFVTDLILDLEMPPNSFKCCVHLRDWLPGEMIVTQVSIN